MKLPQIKTIYAYEPQLLDLKVNQFYRLNPEIEVVHRETYALHRSVESGGVVFCHTLTALVDIYPLVDEEETESEDAS